MTAFCVQKMGESIRCCKQIGWQEVPWLFSPRLIFFAETKKWVEKVMQNVVAITPRVGEGSFKKPKVILSVTPIMVATRRTSWEAVVSQESEAKDGSCLKWNSAARAKCLSSYIRSCLPRVKEGGWTRVYGWVWPTLSCTWARRPPKVIPTPISTFFSWRSLTS